MANPGSPSAMKSQMNSAADNSPQMPKNTMLGMLFAMGIMFGIMYFREEVGSYLHIVFQYIGFDGKYPVSTLILAGLIMTSLSSIVRSVMSDPIKMAKNQHIQKEFNQEMRTARLENNLYKTKKLTEQQPKIMAASMSASKDQMKVMPVTMLIVIPIYAWVFYFLNNHVVNTLINVPWSEGVNLLSSFVLPSWILIYTLISIPIGQLVNKVVRHILLNKRLAELEEESSAAV
jgi:uncharacterized membrane protein (DUF106 family)